MVSSDKEIDESCVVFVKKIKGNIINWVWVFGAERRVTRKFNMRIIPNGKLKHLFKP